MTDFIAMVLTVRVQEEQMPLRWSGYELQRWFLNRVQRYDEALHQSLTEGDGRRPFTVSSLIGVNYRKSDQEPLFPDRDYHVRITSLSSNLSNFLNTILPDLQGQAIRCGEIWLTITDATIDGQSHYLAGSTTDTDLLYESTLESTRTPRHIKFAFDTPTTFRSTGGNTHPFPMPVWVFGSLLRRWNMFNELQIPDDVLRFVEAFVVVGYSRQQTVHIRFEIQESSVHVTGFTGLCRYVTTRHDPYWKRILHALAQYSFYSGCGIRTTMGFGQMRHLVER